MPGHLREYFPRHIAIARQAGKQVFELLVKGSDRAGTLARLSGFLAKHGVDIRDVYSHVDRKTDSFVLVFYVGMAKADQPIERLVSGLRRLGSVELVEYTKMENRVYDQFLHPIYILDDQRALVVRVEALVNIEKRLTQTYGSAGAAIMFEEGKAFAMEGFRMVKEDLPRLNALLTIENMADGFRAHGWGLLEAKKTPGGAEVRVESPPVLKDGESRASSFFLGICAGAVEEAFNLKVKIANSRYDLASDTLVVNLRSVMELRQAKSTVQLHSLR